MRISFQGHLSASDAKRYVDHAFEVPAGASRLSLHFSYEPARVEGVENLLCLSLFDPSGFRGAGHRSGVAQHVDIDVRRATPGYLPGALPPGRWLVEIDTHMIMPGEPCHYRLDISTGQAGPEPAGASPSPPALRAVGGRGPGWYRGDLHTHTAHSDGYWDVAGLLAAARAYRLDFVTLTDHNTVSGLDEMARAASADLLTMGGMELTTYWGHALSLGLPRWIDWRTQPGGRSMPEVVGEVEQAGGTFVIAHPGSVGDPACTGCAWRYPDMMPGPARVVEVWNGPWDNDQSGNEDSLALWYDWLNQGYRMIATAGTDAHSFEPALEVGFSVVYAEALSQAAILEAIRRGHLYLSAGPKITFVARPEEGSRALIPMGDALPAGAAAEIVVGWEGCPSGAWLRLVANGQPLAEWEAEGDGSRTWPIALRHARWCLVEVRDAGGRMIALTNPIFWGEPNR
jgi:hypothetical protein